MHTEKDFQEKLVDLEKEMNETVKEWLKGEMVNKDKWALAYDEGGKQYRIMTTKQLRIIEQCLQRYSIKTGYRHCGLLI